MQRSRRKLRFSIRSQAGGKFGRCSSWANGYNWALELESLRKKVIPVGVECEGRAMAEYDIATHGDRIAHIFDDLYRNIEDVDTTIESLLRDSVLKSTFLNDPFGSATPSWEKANVAK